MFDIFGAPPALAETLARQSGARYLFLCFKDGAAAAQAGAAPEDLQQSLAAGREVGWLRPLPVASGPFHAWEILPPNN